MKRTLSVILTLVLALCGAACAEQVSETGTIPDFTGCFSPFFAECAGDAIIAELTSGYVNDIVKTDNKDGTVDYALTVGEDVRFPDGERADADDVIFSLYVLCDADYRGGSMVKTLPIAGLDAYLGKNLPTLGDRIGAAGRNNTDFSAWDQATQTAFWADIEIAGERFAQSIIDKCVADYAEIDCGNIGADAEAIRSDPELAVKFGMYEWGYGAQWKKGATAADFFHAIEANYPTLAGAASESAGRSLFSFIDDYGEKYGAVENPAASISGITRKNDRTVVVRLASADAAAIHMLRVPIAPLHIFGEAELYNGKDSFGFPKGNLSAVREKSASGVGCGEYRVEKLADGKIALRRGDAITEIASGARTDAADRVFEGYGYLGVNAGRVTVGDDGANEESKALRRAILSVFAACRDEAAGKPSGPELAAARDALAGANADYRLAICTGGTPHPAMEIAERACGLLADMGVRIEIRDMAFAEWLDAVRNGDTELWIGAWRSASDPDLSQLYSTGAPMNYFHIADAELNSLLMAGRGGEKENYRATVNESVREKIAQWGVELTLYHRSAARVELLAQNPPYITIAAR